MNLSHVTATRLFAAGITSGKVTSCHVLSKCLTE